MSILPAKNWTPEKIINLIDQYKSHPALWDPSHKDFKNSELRNQTWLTISEKLQARDAERKMSILIVQYRREVKKIRERLHAGKSENEAASKWFAFEAMSFLKNKMKRQKQTMRVRSPASLLESVNSHENHSDYRITEWKPNTMNSSDVIENVEFDHSIFSRNSHIPHVSKDEYSAFAEMVAIKLRKLPNRYAKNKAMNMITDSLFQIEIECAENDGEETEMVYVKTVEDDR